MASASRPREAAYFMEGVYSGPREAAYFIASASRLRKQLHLERIACRGNGIINRQRVAAAGSSMFIASASWPCEMANFISRGSRATEVA